jgi:phage-related protein
MLDQLRIGDKYSYDDFFASVAERKIGKPKKKVIKETVPFSNTTYDFSAINGEIYWEERELEYTLELDADTPEELEELKIALSGWLMNVMNEDLYDPFIEDYHFKATFEDINFDDEEVEKTTATVKFKAYPYMLANDVKRYSFTIPTNEDLTVKVENNSNHRITPAIAADVPITFSVNGSSYSVGEGVTTDSALMFQVGVNEIIINHNEASGTLTFLFTEEVF